MQIRKAERKRAKLRLGMSGPSGSGKTYSSLLLAFGLGGKAGLIDTENGSGDLYADLGDYDIITLGAPFVIDKYLKAISAFESAEYNTIIIDSLSHAWAGAGGLLDKQGRIADSGKGSSYTAWRMITPEHNSLVEAMLQSPCHILATMRSKVEYVIDKDSRGKDVPKKIGLAPVQRDGMEYEFTLFLEIAQDHTAWAAKDRTGLLDGQYFRITQDTGQTLLAWLESGTGTGNVQSSEGIRPLSLVTITAQDWASVKVEAKRLGIPSKRLMDFLYDGYGIKRPSELPIDKLEELVMSLPGLIGK